MNSTYLLLQLAELISHIGEDVDGSFRIPAFGDVDGIFYRVDIRNVSGRQPLPLIRLGCLVWQHKPVGLDDALLGQTQRPEGEKTAEYSFRFSAREYL